jgi:hypothetical protein
MLVIQEVIPFTVQQVFENEAKQMSAIVSFTMPHPTTSVYQYIHRQGEVLAFAYGEYLTVEPVFNEGIAHVFPLGTIFLVESYESRGTMTRCYILEDDGWVYRVKLLSQYEIDLYMAGLVSAADLL